MLIPLVASVAGAWLLLSILAAVLIGRAVHLADRRRPHTRSAVQRATSTLSRVVELATGAIPIIRPATPD